MGNIFTFGYAKHTMEDFLKKLHRHKINLVIDVRILPLDNNYPEFNKFNLVKILRQKSLDIQYLYLKELACPENITSVKPQELGLLKYYQLYERYLQKQKRLIGDLAQYIKNINSCLFCEETDPQICHRTMIADYLQIQNYESRIKHLI